MAIDPKTIDRIYEKYMIDDDVWRKLIKWPILPPEDAKLDEFLLPFVDETSFIYQVTKNNIFIKDIQPLSIDASGELAENDLDSVITLKVNGKDEGWYYYTFDWRNYQNIFPEAEYNKNTPTSDYFKELTLASLPYAIRSWDKDFESEDATIWYNESVQFGGWTNISRADPGSDQNVANPGLTFLIGVKKTAVDKLNDHLEEQDFSITDLDHEAAIIVRVDSFEKEFDKIFELLKKYDGIRKELQYSFTVTPASFNFKDEAILVRDFKFALKELLHASAMEGAYLPDNPTIAEQKAYAEYFELWNKPKNIIVIGITKKNKVAYVREFAPKKSFRKNLNTISAKYGIQQLGEIKSSRIIGGPPSQSVKRIFKRFKKQNGVKDPRTVSIISKVHGSNGFNGGVKPKFNLDPKKGTPILSIFDFIKMADADPRTAIDFNTEAPDTYQKATARFAKEHGGPIASSAQRDLSGARSNNPSWAKQYEHYTKNTLVQTADSFFANLPEKVKRLRISEAPPYGLDVIWNEVLNQADVRRLTLEAIMCWLDPNEWLEIACRYAMKHLGADEWFENMQKDGTLDDLKAAAEVSSQVTESFAVIALEKRIAQNHFNELEAERKEYIDQHKSLIKQLQNVQAKLKSAKEPQKAVLEKEKNSIELEIKAAVGRRRLVEMDSELAYANQSAGAWVPMSEESALKTAAASRDVTNAIMDLTDPDLKRKICANIVSYSLAATQMLYDLFQSLPELFDYDPDKPTFSFEEPDRPKLETDQFGMYLIEALRAAIAQAIATTILFFVRKLLTEIVEACNRLKDYLWDNLNVDAPNKINKIPGKARFDDLLAQTPTKAARDLTTKLSNFIDVTDPDVVSSLLGLMENLELLLSQLELCALTKGVASTDVLKIIKNLIQIKYNKLYLELKGDSASLSFSTITDFFKNFQPLVKNGYCEEIQKPDDPLQLYQECPPYIRTLCGDLLVGHCTNEQIDNICKRARIERLDKISELIDIAYNPEYTAIPDPLDCGSSNALPHDVYPTNAINEMLMDQNLRPIIGAFRSEVFSFSNRLLVSPEDSGGIGALNFAENSPAYNMIQRHVETDEDTKWGSAQEFLKEQAESILVAKQEKVILKTIKESLINPMTWVPGQSSILSLFYVGGVFGERGIRYYMTSNDDYPQSMDFWYTDDLGGFSKGPNSSYPLLRGPITYPIKNGKAAFLPVARMESFLNLYGETAASVKNKVLNLSPITDPNEVGINKIVAAAAPADLSAQAGEWLISPSAWKFYEEINNAWPDKPIGSAYPSSLEDSKAGLSLIFNVVTRDIGNHIFRRIHDSEIFQTESIKTLEKFFSTFFPQEAFLADESCDVIEASLLKIGDIKEYVRDRDKALSCEPPPSLNEETPNLARAQAEAAVLILARICAFETVLRLLPISASIKMKEMLSSKPIINVIIEHLLYELAMLDYKKTYKTSSGNAAKDIQNLKPTKHSLLDPNSGKLKFSLSPLGHDRYVEEPPTPTIASEGGESFKPKFQAHVVYYANRIMQAKMKKKEKEGKVLIDPVTKEDYTHSNDPYSLNGLAYLITEQMVPMGDFIEKEFEPLFGDAGIKSFERFVLESFFYKDAINGSKDMSNLFDLMPSIKSGLGETEDEDELNIKMNKRFYKFEKTMWPDDGEYQLTDFVNNANFGAGGFLLEPYIRVKQNKKIDPQDVVFDANTEATIKEALAQKAYKTEIEIQGSVDKVIEKECAYKTGAAFKECKTKTITNWHNIVQQQAQLAYDNVISTPLSELLNITGELNPLFGYLDKNNGAYININHWVATMSGKGDSGDLDTFKFFHHSEIASDPHTNWFDPWMYGLRLVYVPPLEDGAAQSDGGDDLEVTKDNILEGFNKYIGVETDKDDPWNIVNKKAYILHEHDSETSAEVSPPVFSIPLIEAEVPVGSLMSGEKELAKQIIKDKAEKEGKTPEEVENAVADFVEELGFAVPLGYFTYQNWANDLDDYPLEQLLCAMVETDGFNRIFGNMDNSVFPLENYKTLLGLHILMQTFNLGEYKEAYFGLFENTKAQLRSIFYSNTLAHDHTKPMATSQYPAARRNEEGMGGFGFEFANLMLGVPPSYAQIFAMTPISILKGLVTIIDPKWADFPWTVPGLIMFLLSQQSGALSGTWFADNIPENFKPQRKALDCPDTEFKKSPKDYDNEELEFVEMMKSYGVPEEDRNSILTVPYHSIPKDHNISLSVTPKETWMKEKGWFKDTPLFNTLTTAWKNKTDDDLKKLGVIFNNLKEYYDTYVEVNNLFYRHFWTYNLHAWMVGEESFFYNKDNNHWIAGSGFEGVLFISCDEVSDIRYNKFTYVEQVCNNKFQHNMSVKQLSVFDKLFSTILSQIDLSYEKYSKNLLGPANMYMQVEGERVSLLSNVLFIGGEPISISEKQLDSEQEIADLIQQNSPLNKAIPNNYFDEQTLANKIAEVLPILVWNNDKLFEFNKGEYNKGIAMSDVAREHWHIKKSEPVVFNSVKTGKGIDNMRSFWLTDKFAKTHTDKWLGNLGSGAVYDFAGANKEELYNLVKEAGFSGDGEDNQFSYAQTLVGNQFDALAESIEGKSGGGHHMWWLLGWYSAEYFVPDAGEGGTWGWNYKDKSEEEVELSTSSLLAPYVKFYDMYNSDDHSKIGEYWAKPWNSPFVVKDQPDQPHGGAWSPITYWAFADLRHETGGMGFEAPSGYNGKGLVLDYIAWYYPSLAAVIAELLYKVHNIALRTQCIYVYEKKTPIENQWEVTISIKQMNKGYWADKGEPHIDYIAHPTFYVNKKAITDDLNSGRFVI